MRFARYTALYGFALAGAAVHGCYSSPGAPAACQSDVDCATGEVCNVVHTCVDQYDPSPFEGCEGDCGAASHAYGDVLATYRGVPAYSNGGTTNCQPCSAGQGLGLGLTCGYRCGAEFGSAAETGYGLAFQCVEYVRRFYGIVYGDAAVGYSTGNANQYVGAKAAALGLVEHVNGEASELPQPDDIIVFYGGSFGHIAIVTQVDPALGEVRIIQQNTGGVAEMTLKYTLTAGRVKFGALPSPLGNYSVHAWLRNEDHDFHACNPNIPCPAGYTCKDGLCEGISCPNPSPSSGALVEPADGAQVGAEFVAHAQVSDANGIVKVTVTVDTLEQCKFSLPISADVEELAVDIPVDLGTCALAPGPHALGLWMEDGCGIATIVDSATIDYEEDAIGCAAGSTCCGADGTPVAAGEHGPQCDDECRRCNGAGACVPAPQTTACAGGQGTCDGAGGCEVDTCGDGLATVDPGEQCDGDALGGASCQDQGFDGGQLACNANCTLDTTGCTQASCGDDALDPGEACDGDDLGGATCESKGFAGGSLDCTGNCQLDTSGCYEATIEASPPTSQWTPDFAPQTDCSCTTQDPDCRTLYVGRAVEVAGNLATMQFQKTDGSGPSVDIKYWVVVGDEQPDCNLIDMYLERASGTWSQSDQTLEVDGIDIWPSESAFNNAPCGESKYLFVISGGGGGFETTRTWFQKQPVRFTKVCE